MKRALVHDTSGFLWSEAGEEKEGLVAQVAVVLPVEHAYSFSVPLVRDSISHQHESSLQIGQRVKVPLGRRGRLAVGFVVGLDRRIWDTTLRPIHSLMDPTSFLSPHLVELGREISAHYGCPLGQTLKAMTPESVRKERGLERVRYARLLQPTADIYASTARMSSKRRKLLESLEVRGGSAAVEDLLRDADTTRAVLSGTVKAGWVAIDARAEMTDDVEPPTAVVEPSFELNDEQLAALRTIDQAIDDARFSVTLLFGVSGSGKTEVYIRAIRRVLERGKQAILLVPEIVLTTQLAVRLASRFPSVALMHSGLTDSQRSVMWRRIAAGQRPVVIGTRGAVFAPCPDLGLICVDEEQEGSFKNLQAPRFHVRDVAIMRAKQLGIPVVLGSATPSLETWYRSSARSDYRRATLSRRVRDLPLPKVHVINMEDEIVEVKQSVVLSRTLIRLLDEALSRGEQGMILMNRRGYAHRIYCPSCRLRLTCPNCNVGLVVHTSIGRTLCHYCRTRIETPTVCPNVTCGAKLLQTGLGTQRIEEILRERFPSAKIARVDSDTMSHRSEYEKIVSDFEARRIDVLLGTQMIAKGLDFPFVSFVGVIGADPVAMATDFRSHERLFQLITQVAGRAGRADAPGRVVVQTMSPELPALSFALRHDYPAFAEAELKDRARVGLPPFQRLARIVLTHVREETARRECETLQGRIADAIKSLDLQAGSVLGPNPCAISRLRGRYRYELLIRTASASDLRRLLQKLHADHALRNKAESTMLDVDPVSFM